MVANPIDVDKLYKQWVESLGEPRINLKYPSLRGLHDWFLRETERLGIDPETIDFEALVDPTLTYQENKTLLAEMMRAPPTEKEYESMYEEHKAEMLERVREQYPEIMEPLLEQLAELGQIEDKKKRYQKLVKTLRWELEVTKRRLEELEKRPPTAHLIKLRALEPIEMGIFRYRAGQEFETVDLEWARKLIAEGFAVEVPLVGAPPPLPPVKPPEVKPIEKVARVKIRVEGGAKPSEYIARMLFDSFEAGFVGFFSTERLDEYLRKGKDEVDWRENLRMAGFSPEEIEEELKTYPEPFKEGVPIQVHWIYPEDVSFDAVAQHYWSIAHLPYERAMLEPKTVSELQEIARIKGLRVLETKEELINVILGVVPAVRPAPPPPTLIPPPKRELTSVEKKRLEDEFKVMLMRELGRIPRDSMAEFRLELDAVKMLRYEEALKVIMALAREIIDRQVRVRPPIMRPPEVRPAIEVGVPPPEFVPPPPFMPLPDKPLCPELPFPRGLCSAEKTWLLDAFKNRLEREGIDVRRYLEAFREQLWVQQFRDWSEVIKRFDFITETIIREGIKAFFITRPPMPWGKPEEQVAPPSFVLSPTQKRDAIIHMLSLAAREGPLKKLSWDEFLDFLKEQGVFEVTQDEARKVAKEAWAEKNLWFLNVDKESLNAILGEDWLG